MAALKLNRPLNELADDSPFQAQVMDVSVTQNHIPRDASFMFRGYIVESCGVNETHREHLILFTGGGTAVSFPEVWIRFQALAKAHRRDFFYIANF